MQKPVMTVRAMTRDVIKIVLGRYQLGIARVEIQLLLLFVPQIAEMALK